MEHTRKENWLWRHHTLRDLFDSLPFLDFPPTLHCMFAWLCFVKGASAIDRDEIKFKSEGGRYFIRMITQMCGIKINQKMAVWLVRQQKDSEKLMSSLYCSFLAETPLR